MAKLSLYLPRMRGNHGPWGGGGGGKFPGKIPWGWGAGGMVSLALTVAQTVRIRSLSFKKNPHGSPSSCSGNCTVNVEV